MDSRLKISGMTEKKVVTPEWFYHPLFVTPAIFKPGSTALKAFGFPIKDFGNDGGRGRSIRNLNYLRAKIPGCLIKALRHDERRRVRMNQL
ncbi:MAG: hypothetical protein PHI00_07665 [Atribacterota bacterium]|nr:hypothetical protein [Atribacterota bacterium]